MLTLEQYEALNPTCQVSYQDVVVSYLTPSTHLKWRVDTLFDKEPATMEWIAGFRQDEILVDVGANVGPITQAGVQRDLLLYDIRVMEPQAAASSKESAAAPAVKFSF